jgi:hypothetical protein
MTACIIPFPTVRRRAFVLKHAARMASLPHKTADKLLAAQLDVQRATMARRGIAPELVDEQMRALEIAVRSELWRMVLTPGGAA